MSNTLTNIQELCKNKTIIIVGNASSILNYNHGRFIDSHQIVVRMNYALPINNKFSKSIGSKTDIYSVGISRAKVVNEIINKSNIKYVLRMSPWGEVINGNNVFNNDKESYYKVKSNFGEFKPTTGCLTVNFFKEHIDFKSLTLIGFDFFRNINNVKRNEFKSYLYKDHNPILEQQYITNMLNSNIKIIKT